jgi:hypothetical protein
MSAVPPYSEEINKWLKKAEKTTDEEKRNLQKDEQLSGLLDLPGWDVFKQIVNSRIEALEGLLEIDDSFKHIESTGFKFLATRLVIKHLRELVDLPYVVRESRKINE